MIHAVLGSVSLNKLLVGTLLAFACVSSYADDLKVADDFKSGDLVSADTFNQIFDTIEKINRTVVDSDLVGVWKCSAVHASSDNYNGWTDKGIVYELTDAQVNFTASSTETSLESAYSYSTSSPTPFFRSSDPAEAETGTYQFYRGLLVLRNATTTNRGVATTPWKLDVVSDTRFTMEKNNPGGNTPELVVCDSALAVPASPTAPTATNNKTGINLAWTDASLDETGFKVYRKLSSESEAKLIATQAAVTYSDTDLTEGQTAYYHVTAYNDNGDSAKSKAVSATLDSTAPTVASTSPANGVQVAVTDRNLSITFSEKIKVICPSDATKTSGPTCPDSGSAVIAQGVFNDLRGSPGQYDAKLYGSIAEVGSSYTSTLSGDLVGSAEQLKTKDTITVTVKKEWIQDIGGNQLESDFVFSFTTP